MAKNRQKRSPATDWRGLLRLAYEQAGYFTTAQAKDHGIGSELLHHRVAVGDVERTRRGVYRLTNFPSSDSEDLVVFWLWSEREGVFSHGTALMLHNISDALPGVACMTVPDAWRSRRMRVPSGLHLHYGDVAERDVTWINHVPVTRALRTVVDCEIDGMSPEVVGDALRDALYRRIFTLTDFRNALKAERASRRPRIRSRRSP